MKSFKSVTAILLISTVLLATSCRHSKNKEWREYQNLRLDTLVNIAKQMPANLTFTIPEMEEEIAQIKSDLNIVRFAPANAMDAQSDQTIKQYLRLLSMYQEAVPNYRKAITLMEESLLALTQFKKSIKEGVYTESKEEFKNEYAYLKQTLLSNALKVSDAGSKSGYSHAAFIRLSKQVSTIILEKVDESDLPQD